MNIINTILAGASKVDATVMFHLFNGSDSFIAIVDGIKLSFNDYKKI